MGDASALRTSEDLTGETLARKYRLLRRRGAGAMGAVYEAENLHTGRVVAVKLLLRDAPGVAAKHRFLREARAASKLRHDHIVDVLDLDEDPATGRTFLVQEYLVGEDLRRVLDARGPLRPAEALSLLLPVLRALRYAHAEGVVHRDVKPDNIFVARMPDGALRPKVIDFGIAQWHDGESPEAKLTQTGAVLGTPYYMAPEVARGETADARADVWSAAVVLFEALSGRRPFEHRALPRVLAAILVDPIPALDALVSGLPPALVHAVHAGLVRNARERPDMAAFVAALEAIEVPDDLVATPRVAAAVTFTPEHAAETLASTEDPATRPAPRPLTPAPPRTTPSESAPGPMADDSLAARVLPPTVPRGAIVLLAVAVALVVAVAALRPGPAPTPAIVRPRTLEPTQLTLLPSPTALPSPPSPAQPAVEPAATSPSAPAPDAHAALRRAPPRPAPRVLARPSPTAPATPPATPPATRPATPREVVNGAPIVGL